MAQPPDKSRSPKQYSLGVVLLAIQVLAAIITVTEKLPIFPLNDGVTAQSLSCAVQVGEQKQK